jgi:Family of unknown function (DUF6412)
MLWALTAYAASPAIFFALAVLLARCLHRARSTWHCASTPRTVGLRSRARRAVFLRLRDPDAAGRPRPRAPSTASAIA